MEAMADKSSDHLLSMPAIENDLGCDYVWNVYEAFTSQIRGILQLQYVLILYAASQDMANEDFLQASVH